MTSRSLGHRAPLLWLALPWISGLTAGRVLEPDTPAWLLAGALGLAVTALGASHRAPRTWGAALVLAMFLAGSADYALQRRRLPTWDSLPAREARLEFRVDRLFAPTGSNKTSGLATVVHTDVHLRELIGQRLYFSLPLPPRQRPPALYLH